MRFVIVEGDIYDLSDGSLCCLPIGECYGRKIYTTEALLEKLEGIISPTVVFPIEHDADIIARARWFE